MCVGFGVLSFRCMICVLIDLGAVIFLKLLYIVRNSINNVAYSVVMLINVVYVGNNCDYLSKKVSFSVLL